MKMPRKKGSLSKKKAEGAHVRIVYSPMVGFETTAPMAAITVMEVEKNNINNLFFFTAHKIVPPAMKALVY